jgi:hypothetical protein
MGFAHANAPADGLSDAQAARAFSVRCCAPRAGRDHPPWRGPTFTPRIMAANRSTIA